MSAPNTGRQSPSPDRQTGSQLHDTTADGGIGAGPKNTDSKGASEDHKSDVLSSNPEHPLDASAEAKTSKDGRGEGI